MENTDVCPDEGQKAGMLCRKLFRKVDEMWHKTYDMRRRISIFYEDVVLPLSPPEEKKENARRWKADFNDFAERWKEIDDGKDEIDWLIIDLNQTIEDEEKKRQKKTEKTSIEEQRVW